MPETTPVVIHESLRDFVERALEETTELSAEQVEAIRERVFDWYLYYGRTASWLKLDFADTEQTRWMHQYFRETLLAFVTGWDTLEHVYYAVEMVMIGFTKEYLRIANEGRLGSEQQQTEKSATTATTTAHATAEKPPAHSDNHDILSSRRPATVKKRPARPAEPEALKSADQFNLFG